MKNSTQGPATSKLKPYLAILAWLRLGTRQKPGQQQEDLDTQDRMYAHLLVEFEPEVVKRAADEWLRTSEWWPETAPLLKLCREHARLVEIERRPRLQAPPPTNAEARRNRNAEQTMAQWEANDQLAMEIRQNVGRFFCGVALLELYAAMAEKRLTSHPELANTYYVRRAGDDR